MKADQLELLRQLADGRKSYREIAREMSLSENTVRSRVRALLEEGGVEISARIDPGRLDDHEFVYVAVMLDTMDITEKVEEFSKLRGVVSVAAVTGRFHLILQVLLTPEFGLLEFFRDEVSTVEHVSYCETFVVFASEKLFLPYVH